MQREWSDNAESHVRTAMECSKQSKIMRICVKKKENHAPPSQKKNQTNKQNPSHTDTMININNEKIRHKWVGRGGCGKKP